MFDFVNASKKFSFVEHFKLFGIISIILCSIGLVGIILTLFGVPALNLDLDFAGGVKMDIELGTPVTREVQEQVEEIYSDVAGVTANVTTSGDSGTGISVKTVEIPSDVREEVFDKVAETFGADKVSLLETKFVSAAVGNDLKRSAFIATALACVFILLYITIRFEFKSGLAAIVCLIHDVLIMLSAFVIFRIPVNMTFIAAALTIVGYSINATIVVFDRVRENKKLLGNINFGEIVDKSVWQTMRRSVGTTITTLLPIVVLIIIGVSSIRVFAIPLMIGVISGGYSSTCISGSVWNALGKKGNKKK